MRQLVWEEFEQFYDILSEHTDSIYKTNNFTKVYSCTPLPVQTINSQMHSATAMNSRIRSWNKGEPVFFRSNTCPKMLLVFAFAGKKPSVLYSMVTLWIQAKSTVSTSDVWCIGKVTVWWGVGGSSWNPRYLRSQTRLAKGLKPT